MSIHPTIEACLTWEDQSLAFLGSSPGLVRELRLDEPGEVFGLLEPVDDGWMLCIPAGARAQVRLGGVLVDLERVTPEPSGERRLPVREDLEAEIHMGEFHFTIRRARHAA